MDSNFSLPYGLFRDAKLLFLSRENLIGFNFVSVIINFNKLFPCVYNIFMHYKLSFMLVNEKNKTEHTVLNMSVSWEYERRGLFSLIHYCNLDRNVQGSGNTDKKLI